MVGVVALLAVGAGPRHSYVKSITCDRLHGKYTNCQVTLWDRHQGRYVTYPVSDKRKVFCFNKKLTDCVLRVWHPRLEKYRFYWGAVRRRHPRSWGRRRIGEPAHPTMHAAT